MSLMVRWIELLGFTKVHQSLVRKETLGTKNVLTAKANSWGTHVHELCFLNKQ